MAVLTLKNPLILLREPQVRESWDWSVSGRGKDGAFECAWSKGLERRLSGLRVLAALASGAPVRSSTSKALHSSEITQPPHKHTDMVKTNIKSRN